MSRYLDPKSDVVFKKIFGEHPHLLKSFLNALLPLKEDEQIASLEYLQYEQSPRISVLKNTVVDVKCKDIEGRTFVVEMQLQWTDSFMQRMLFGTSQAYVKQLQKGEDFKFLNPVYGLGIIGTIFDRSSDEWYHHYKLVNVQNPARELKGLQIVFLELPKFKPQSFSGQRLRALWLRFLSEVNEQARVIDNDLLDVPEIKKAIDLAEEAGYTQAELEAYDRYWDAVSREKALLSGRFAEGRAEGISEGKRQMAEALARRLLEKKLPFGEIADLTGLNIKEIEKLKDEQ